MKIFLSDCNKGKFLAAQNLKAMLMKKTVINTRFKSVFVASMASMIGAYILMLTDNIAAGQIVEDEAAAAMTLISPITYQLLFISYLIADGLVMMVSYAQGRQDRAEVNRLFSIGIILAVVVGIICTIVLVFGKAQILSIWEISPRLMNYAADYYVGIMLLPVIMFLNIFIYTIFIAEGREKICVLATFAAFVVNVVLDIVLCNLIGIMGIGLATLTGYIVSLTVQIYYLTGGRSQLKFVRYFSLRKTLQGIFYSFYHSIDTLCLSLLPMLLSAAVISKFGEENLIIVTVAQNLLTLIFAIYTGIVDCLQPMTCQYHAEGNLHSVKKTIVLCLKVTAALSLLMSVLGIIFANFLPMLFNVDDSIVAARAAEAMRYWLPFTIFLGNTLTCANYYIYIERMNYGAFVKIMLLLIMPYLAMKIDVETMNEFWLLIGASFLVAEIMNWLITKIFFKGLLMIDAEKINRQISYDINGTIEEVDALKNNLDGDLNRLNVAENLRGKIISIVEEIGRKIVEGNEKIIQLEISILTDDAQITLMIRDNGELREQGTGNREELAQKIYSLIPSPYSLNFSSSGDENCVIVGIKP